MSLTKADGASAYGTYDLDLIFRIKQTKPDVRVTALIEFESQFFRKGTSARMSLLTSLIRKLQQLFKPEFAAGAHAALVFERKAASDGETSKGLAGCGVFYFRVAREVAEMQSLIDAVHGDAPCLEVLK